MLDTRPLQPPELPSFIRKQYPFPRAMLQTSWGAMHYVDTGGSGRSVLLLHGNPTWSFLYRKVLRRLEGHGLRLVAPDLIGLGLSAKPRDWREHSLRRHGETMLEFIRALDLRNVVLVVQDWGGPIGAWAAAADPTRVTALVVLNTSLLVPQRFVTTPFHRLAQAPLLSDFVFRTFNFPMPFMNRVQGDKHSLDHTTLRAYQWPLRKILDRSAPLALARMVPNTPKHPTVAELVQTDRWYRSFPGPVEIVWGVRDPILGHARKRMCEAAPQARVTETQAGHFLQEEVPEVIAAAIQRVSLA